jgi:hypothetical protein
MSNLVQSNPPPTPRLPRIHDKRTSRQRGKKEKRYSRIDRRANVVVVLLQPLDRGLLLLHASDLIELVHRRLLRRRVVAWHLADQRAVDSMGRVRIWCWGVLCYRRGVIGRSGLLEVGCDVESC